MTLAQVFSCKFCEIFKNIFFHGIPPVAAFEKLKAEAVIWRCSVKKVFFKISLHSQQNTCARVSFLLKVSEKGLFLWILRTTFYEYLFYRKHLVVAPVKTCNFTSMEPRHGCIFVKFLKLSGTHYDALLEFSKSSQKYWRKNIC